MTDRASAEGPTQTHSAEYNRGWADGQASALDATQPVIDGLQARLTDRASAEGLREAIDAALHELGDPGPRYPAPVANAVDILRAALRDTGPRLTPDGYDQRSWEAGWNAALEDTPDRADHRGRSPGDCERCAHEHLAWAIQQLRENERTEPGSPFWQGWDAALEDTPDRADHRGRSPGDCERCAHEHLATPDRADPARMSDAAWAIQQLRENERTEPDSPFWQGWDAALAAIEVALRDTEPRPDSRLSTPRTETSE